MLAAPLSTSSGPPHLVRWASYPSRSVCSFCVRPHCVGVVRRFETGRTISFGSRKQLNSNYTSGLQTRSRRSSIGVGVTARSQGARFPFFSGSSKKLLTDVADTLEKELGPHLSPSRTPPDVTYFRSADGNAEGSVVLRSGNDAKVDFSLQSWIHAALPFGTLDIGTIVIMVGTERDSPHFLFEFILSGNALVVVLDHLPRKDLVLDSAYLERFYGNTGLNKIRELFEAAPGCKPYISPVLFVRSVVSPTALLFRLAPEGEGSLDEQIAQVVYPAATQMFQAWLDSFRTRGSQVQDVDTMLRRDQEIKDKGVEVDLSSNLPRIYGQEIADRIIAAFRAGK